MKQDINATLVSQSSTDLVPPHNSSEWKRRAEARKPITKDHKAKYPALPSESYKVPPCVGHEIENQKEEAKS